MRKILALAAAAAAIVPVTAQAAELIQNGSFEQGVNPNSTGVGFVTLTGGDMTSIPGWTVTGGSIDYIGNYWQAADGVRSIDLNGTSSGGLSQTFNTIAGKLYTVTYDLAGNPDQQSNKTVLTVLSGGNYAQLNNFNSTGHTRSDMGWTPFSFTFTAGGATSTIQFTSLTAGAYGAALDAVSVSGVPEPATWALMILGFGAVGGAMRRRSASRGVALA